MPHLQQKGPEEDTTSMVYKATCQMDNLANWFCLSTDYGTRVPGPAH